MMLSRRMLAPEDEVQTTDMDVRKEDQEKINRFSSLHQRQLNLEEKLQGKNKDKEDLEEVSMELELADEDEHVPYKMGDSFFSLPLEEVQSLLSASTEHVTGEISTLEDTIKDVKEELQQLKFALYARFGRGINLET